MRVVICGAGIAGLTLANRVSAHGGEVVLVERAPGPRSQGYMIDFFGPGYDAVEAMGLLPALEEVAYRVDEATLLDEHGRRRGGISFARLAGTVGGRLLSVMRPDLERVLRTHLPSTITPRFGTSPVAVSDHGGTLRVTLDDGEVLDADLLVGADGIHSTIRGLVFGDERRFLRPLGFHTSAFRFHSPAVHAAVRGRFGLTDTIDRQMGFYALRDGHVAAFSVHRTEQDPPRDVRTAVREIYRGLGWVVGEALDRCPPSAEIYYDQVAQIEMPTWSRGRVVLVGDACHAVSLLAGQGASLGIAGAYVLADRLAATDSITSALEEYERLCRPGAERTQRGARAGARWFLPTSRTELWIRRAALRLARLPLIDRHLATALIGGPTTLINPAGGAHPQS